MATRSGRLSKPDAQGHFVRQLGYRLSASGKRVQHKFRLGSNRADAELRASLLRKIWDQMEADDGTEMPLWDDLTLEIAKQVAKGATPVLIPPQQPTEHARDYTTRVQSTRERFPFLQFAPTYPEDRVGAELRKMREQYQPSNLLRAAQVISNAATSRDVDSQSDSPSTHFEVSGDHYTLHQGLDAYEAWCKDEYIDPRNDGLSEYGHTKIGQLKTLRERHEDVPLNTVRLDQIESMYRYWRRRPESRARGTAGKPMSRDSVRHFIGELKRFFKWLHRSDSFHWRKPDGFDDLDTSILVDTCEIKNSIRQVETFSLADLCSLNRHATPIERVYLLLGLNCGFGPKEIATISVGECFLNQGLPRTEQELFDYPTTNNLSFVSLVRNKTTIVGKFLLFAQTATMLQWVMKRRIAQPNFAADQPLLLNSNNKPLDQRSKNGNPSRQVANAFARLKKRCQDNDDPVSDLPFKCLRKTAGDLIRRFSDGEVAGVFLLHGSPVKTDNLSDVYTNRPFGKVYRTIEKVETYLQPVFAESTSPTSAQPQAYTPRKVVDRIAEMHANEKSVREIATTLKLSKSAVHRHLARMRSS